MSTKGANLHFLLWSLELTHGVGAEFHYFSGAYIVLDMKSEIGEGAGFGSGCVCIVLLAYYNRCAAEAVAGGDDSVFQQQEHGAGALDATIHIFYAAHKVAAFAYERGNHLGGVDDVVAVLAEMVAFGKQLLFKFLDVVDACNGHNGEFA